MFVRLGDHQEDQGRLAVPLGVIDAVESVVEEQEDRAAEIDLQIVRESAMISGSVPSSCSRGPASSVPRPMMRSPRTPER